MAKRAKNRATARRSEHTVDPKTLADLVPDVQNARRHTERNLAMIDESLATVGAGRSVVIDEGGRLLAGNATVSRAKEKGLKLRVVDTDADTIIAVRRLGLTEDQKTALALYDNRAAELAEWDPAMLAQLAEGGFNLGQLFGDAELRNIMAALDEAQDGLTDPDAVPDVRKTSIKVGDLYQLDGHRLLCGDSTSATHVERLMDGQRAGLFATDPPYLIDYTETVRGRKVKARDDADSRDWDNSNQGRALFDGFIQTAIAHAVTPRAAWYCWHASRRQALLEQVWEDAGAFVHQQIVWVKTRASFGRSVYMWRHELCFFGWVRGQRPLVRLMPLSDGKPTTTWSGRKDLDVPSQGELPSTAWLIPSSEIESVEHPTSKPTRLFSIPMLMHTGKGDACYEPFSGSGSQLIAAEQTGRRCFAMELEPKYVQQAIDRWEAFTGKKAELIGRGTPMGRKRPHRPKAGAA